MPADLIYRKNVLRDLIETLENRLSEAFGHRVNFTLLIQDDGVGSHLTNTPMPQRALWTLSAVEAWNAAQTEKSVFKDRRAEPRY